MPVLLYACFATLWILFSDRLLGALVVEHETLLAFSILKGFLYVAVTSLLLYWLLRRKDRSPDARPHEPAAGPTGLVAWPRWTLYAIAIVLSLAAILVRRETAVAFADRPLLIMMVLPITIAAALGGFGPGLTATILTGAAAGWSIPPAGSFAIGAAHDLVQWAMLAADGLLISLLSELMHRSRRQETDRCRQLLTAQDSLRESEGRYRELFESNPHPMWIYDTETLAFLAVNNAAVIHYGYSREQFLAMTIRDIRPPEEVPRLLANISSLSGGLDNAGIWRHRKADGAIIEVEITSHTLHYAGRPAELVLAHDVTERRRAEEALAQSEQKFRGLFENHAAVKLIIDPENGDIVDANAAAAAFYGWPVETLRSMKIAEINTLPPVKIREEMERARRSQRTHFEFQHRKAGGGTAEVEVFSSRVTIGGKEYLHSIIHDITEKRHLENQLLQARKMESVGRLAGGVAHDFNNMLTVILGNTEMAMSRVPPSDPLHNDLRDIHSAAKRSAAITRQLLAFARKQAIRPRPVDLNETVEGMLKMLRRLIGEDIDLAWLPGSGLWPVLADPSQIDQVLANLCLNARDAIIGVGKVTIETGNATFDAAYCADHLDCLPGDFVLLAVRDDGCGMDRATLDHLFEPFFTTKEVGQGTGLGLATVYGIVQQNHGFINVTSAPRQGTIFRIHLPRYTGGADRLESPGGKAVPGGAGETVLVVEDDLAILDLIRRILERRGYNVLDAPTPGQALDVAARCKKRIDLLLTDVIMPEMNGRDLAGRLLTSHPDLKVLYMSGYTANVIAQHGVLDSGIHFLQKPFGITDLADKVGEVLGGEQESGRVSPASGAAGG